MQVNILSPWCMMLQVMSSRLWLDPWITIDSGLHDTRTYDFNLYYKCQWLITFNVLDPGHERKLPVTWGFGDGYCHVPTTYNWLVMSHAFTGILRKRWRNITIPNPMYWFKHARYFGCQMKPLIKFICLTNCPHS